MPKKITTLDKAAQERNARHREKLRELAAYKKYQQKQRDAQKKERDAILRETLRLAKGKGIYDPKSLKLTKYRATQARKIQRQYGEFLNSEKYFFVKPKAGQTKEFVERGNALNMKTTSKGIFIAKEGHKKASVKYDRKKDELYIERSGKKRSGNAGTVKHRTITPLASLDALDNERDRLRNLAKKLGPLGKGERLIFTVHENGVDGYSTNTFSNIELLLQHLDTYQKSTPQRVQFFRHVTLEKRGLEEYHNWQKTVWRPQLEERKKERLKAYGKEYRSRVKKLDPKGRNK